jgi:outer membrane lipoprotein SlyB
MRRIETITLAATLLLAGCQSTLTGDYYSRDDARRIQTVQYGSVEATRPVVIEGTKTAVGPVAGGAVGGIAGSTVGGGKGSSIAAVVGAVAGGVAGAAAEEGLTRRQGIDITVRLDGGRVISVVQEQTPQSTFRVGDRVRVLTLNGETRIAR